jgi:periplasmic divalent cation tolerance protein
MTRPEDPSQVIVVLTTVGSEEQANLISAELVQRGLAACVNVVPGVKSVYKWKGKIWQDEERLLMIKTTTGTFQELRRAIKSLHSYELPEIIALPVELADDAVLDWIRGSVVGFRKNGA